MKGINIGSCRVYAFFVERKQSSKQAARDAHVSREMFFCIIVMGASNKVKE